MKYLTFLILILPTPTLAANKRMAMVQNGVVTNIANWDGVSTWSPADFTLVDVTSQKDIDIGWTCVKCDGSDFVAPSGN